MSRAAVFVLSSAWEGFGDVLRGSSSLRLVVSTDSPSGPAALLHHGRYGRWVPVGDLDAPPPRDQLTGRATLFTVERAVDQYVKTHVRAWRQSGSGVGRRWRVVVLVVLCAATMRVASAAARLYGLATTVGALQNPLLVRRCQGSAAVGSDAMIEATEITSEVSPESATGHRGALVYSRESPSPRYRKLLALYQQMHLEGEPSLGIPAPRTFAGGSLLRHASAIKRLIDATGARTLLDYGAGKGQQYAANSLELPDGTRIGRLVDYWRVALIATYDPAYQPLSRLPSGEFDGVVCTDVLEHCPEDDLPWIVDELFGFARRFVFANIASFPAIKTLPNGENAHCTVQPPAWWAGLLHAVAHRHPGIRYRVLVDTRIDRQAFLGWRRKPAYRTAVLDNGDGPTKPRACHTHA